jgi:hypothetical protein
MGQLAPILKNLFLHLDIAFQPVELNLEVGSDDFLIAGRKIGQLGLGSPQKFLSFSQLLLDKHPVQLGLGIANILVIADEFLEDSIDNLGRILNQPENKVTIKVKKT